MDFPQLAKSFRKQLQKREKKQDPKSDSGGGISNSLALGFKERVYWSCEPGQHAAHTNPPSFKWQGKKLFLDGLTLIEGWELHHWESRKRGVPHFRGLVAAVID